jgi:hypothetical protein
MGPQQPEIGRSGRTFLDPDHAEDVLDAEERPSVSGDTGTVPPDNRPGHHPAHDQDRPDLDAFAERLGTKRPDER